MTLRGIGSDDKFAQVVLALNQFNDNLEAIQHAITENAEKLAASVVMHGHKEVGEEQQEAATERHQHEIQIINRVPQVLLEVIQKQFIVMQQWLQPVQQMTHVNSTRVEQLEQGFQQTLQRYADLLKWLEDGKIVISLKA